MDAEKKLTALTFSYFTFNYILMYVFVLGLGHQ